MKSKPIVLALLALACLQSASSQEPNAPKASLEGRDAQKGQPMFTIQPVNRKYDRHREDGCTVLTIKVAGWEGNEFGLWLPEFAHIQDQTVWANHPIKGIITDDRFQQWVKSPDGSYKWTRDFGNLVLTSEIVPDERNSCLWYTHSFKNTSDKTMKEVSAGTCFHLVNAPQFISIAGERYWACLDGAWTTLDKVPRVEAPGIDPRRVIFLRKGIRTERTVLANSFPAGIMGEQAYHPLIMAENFSGTASVGIADLDFKQVSNNNDQILRCLHSAPMPIDTIEPGQTKSHRAVLIFLNGNHQDLLKHYEKITKQLREEKGN
ncbi:MAG: hypothetical protein WC405_20795 [Syntrophales bacterium]